MRPLPASRVGHAHGLLRALDQRGKLRPDEFVTEFDGAELFPPDAEPDTGRTRQLLSLLRVTGLAGEAGGTVELTDLGRRYVRSGDPSDVFAVSPGQAEWLRRSLREKHLTDSVWHGAAIGLSLYSTLGPGEWVAATDFGRAAAHLGRAGWDNENTFRLQGERFTALLADMELIGAGDHRLTPTGAQKKGELRVALATPLLELAGQLHPEGPAGVAQAAEAERPVAAAPPPPPPPPPPPVEEEETFVTAAAMGPIEAAALAAAEPVAVAPPPPPPPPPARVA